MEPSPDLLGRRCSAPPLLAAAIRTCPEDFVVREVLGFELTGAGEHIWLRVRKREFTTDYLAGLLAAIAGIRRGEVGYAGLKDKFAVTEQWFSLQAPKGEPDWSALPAGVEVLEATRHNRKLRTGALKGNEFELVLRHCRGDREALAQRVAEIARDGFPNYFGEQRFGHGGANLAHAEAMFMRRERVKDRYRRGIYISAARSAIFNAVLDARVADGSWCHAIPGDVMQLDGSSSWFVIDEPDEEIVRRCREGDIHPTGPLWGDGDPPVHNGTLQLEKDIAARFDVLSKGLADTRMDHDRRALRAIPKHLSAAWLDDTTVRLQFFLPAGSYATVLLRELAAYEEAARFSAAAASRSPASA
jgi:tRNA pseudouridine13 synthase